MLEQVLLCDCSHARLAHARWAPCNICQAVGIPAGGEELSSELADGIYGCVKPSNHASGTTGRRGLGVSEICMAASECLPDVGVPLP